jgi:type IV fimbrial biogenesis protein FimT
LLDVQIERFMLIRLKHIPHSKVSPAFTLVEMMVTLAVFAILVAIAGPSFRDAIANQKVQAGAEAILNGLQLAQTEAIHRNMNVSFTLGGGTAWTVAVVSPSATIQTRPDSESGGGLTVTSLNNQNLVSFTATGAVANYDPLSALTQITVAPPAGISGVNTFRIDITAAGQLRLCNLSISTANDPRKC